MILAERIIIQLHTNCGYKLW